MAQLNFEEFLGTMLEHAYEDFGETAEYKANKLKQENMELLCESMFMEEERQFAEECFDTIYHMVSEETRFIYRQGMRDCIRLLRELEVIR